MLNLNESLSVLLNCFTNWQFSLILPIYSYVFFLIAAMSVDILCLLIEFVWVIHFLLFKPLNERFIPDLNGFSELKN